MKSLSKRNKIIIAVLSIVAVVTIGIFVNKYIEDNRAVEVVHEEIYTIEYGSDFELKPIQDLYVDYDNNINELKVDTYKMGGYGYPFTVKKTDMTLNVIVEDTQMPTMEGELNYETEEGTEIDYKQLKAKDVVDGELEITYEGDVDFNTPADYEIIATTKDKNDNELTQTITIKVTKKPEPIVSKPNVNNSTSKPNSNSNNTANKPSTGKTGGSTQKPTETPKPTEPVTPQRPGPDAPAGRIYYADYGTHNACRASADKVLQDNFRTMRSTYCDDWGYMYYRPHN